jgi:hypothetical protein
MAMLVQLCSLHHGSLAYGCMLPRLQVKYGPQVSVVTMKCAVMRKTGATITVKQSGGGRPRLGAQFEAQQQQVRACV